jgi:hypothetical protein
VEALVGLGPLLADPLKIAGLVADVGDNGQVNRPEFRPLFERLAEVAREALM